MEKAVLCASALISHNALSRGWSGLHSDKLLDTRDQEAR
jgi:hypothetical protein